MRLNREALSSKEVMIFLDLIQSNVLLVLTTTVRTNHCPIKCKSQRERSRSQEERRCSILDQFTVKLDNNLFEGKSTPYVYSSLRFDARRLPSPAARLEAGRSPSST